MRRAAILLLCASAFAQMGPLVQSSTNPNFFQRPDGKTIVLAGSHTWNNLQDTSESSSIPEAFDFAGFVTFLQNHGHNATFLWAKGLPKYCSWGGDSISTTWYMNMFPWARSSTSGAGDGGNKFDLTISGTTDAPTMAASSINQAYFDRLKTRVEALGNANIYAFVYLFDGLGLLDYRCGTNTDGYPFSSGNNINSLADDNAQSSMTMTGANAILAVQEAYVKKVLDTLNAEPNVIYVISEEAPTGSGTFWSPFMIDLIHKYEGGGTFHQTGKADETFSAKTYQHPVIWPMLNVNTASDGTVLNSAADAVALCGQGTGSTCLTNNANTPANHTVPATYGSGATTGNKCGTGSPTCKVSVTDSDHNYFSTMWTDTQQTNRNVIWENFTNGNSYVYMDPYLIWWPSNSRNNCDSNSRPTNAVCSAIVSTSNGWQENIRKNLGYVVTYGNTKLTLGTDTPQGSLAQTGFALANNSATVGEFLVYFPSGGANWVNLSAQSGHSLKVEWFDPATGSTYSANDYLATSSTQQSFTPPNGISTDAVLWLQERQNTVHTWNAGLSWTSSGSLSWTNKASLSWTAAGSLTWN